MVPDPDGGVTFTWHSSYTTEGGYTLTPYGYYDKGRRAAREAYYTFLLDTNSVHTQFCQLPGCGNTCAVKETLDDVHDYCSRECAIDGGAICLGPEPLRCNYAGCENPIYVGSRPPASDFCSRIHRERTEVNPSLLKYRWRNSAYNRAFPRPLRRGTTP